MKHTLINKVAYIIVTACILAIFFSAESFASSTGALDDDFIGPRQQTETENVVVDRQYIEDMYRNYYINTMSEEQQKILSVDQFIANVRLDAILSAYNAINASNPNLDRIEKLKQAIQTAYDNEVTTDTLNLIVSYAGSSSSTTTPPKDSDSNEEGEDSENESEESEKSEENETYEDKVYNIEDVIFNRIPILDINFFSNKAAGQPVKEGSVVYILRNIVSTWYVSFRNLAIVALAILLIYTGVRIAISTIPSKKANYQRMLFGWLQAIIIVMTIHYIMIVTINVNNSLVEMLDNAQQSAMTQGEWEEESIYDTIRTRAYDTRLSVGLPAMIMYIVLIMIWLKFIWVYIKRSFTILILIVVAPFISAKYAIDSASGKKGASLTSWIYDFVMNVLLQAVHSIIYVALISTALNLSIQSIMGFIIALVLFNFMLKADEIFRNIFSFDKSKLVGETATYQDRKDIMKDFAGIAFVGQMAKGGIGVVKGSAKMVMGFGKSGYKFITKINPDIKKNVNNGLNFVDEKIEKWTKPANNSRSGIIKDMQNAVYYGAKVRRLSRADGSMGIKARKIKKDLKSRREKRYKSNYKFIKSTITGTGSVILAVPLTVINPQAGIALASKGVSSLGGLSRERNVEEKKNKNRLKGYRRTGIYKVYYGNKKAKAKYEKKRTDLYKSITQIDQINKKENKITNKFKEIIDNGNTSTNEINRFKETVSAISEEANKEKINRVMNRYMTDNSIERIDKSSINGIIETVVGEVGGNMQLSDADQRIIENSAKAKTRGTRGRSGNTYTKDDITELVTNTIIEKTVDNKFKDIAKDVVSLQNKINEAEKTADTNYRHANKFIQNL